MHPFPHYYEVTSSSDSATNDAPIQATNLELIDTAPPVEFGGPGDKWSPESLLIGAVASCFILSFRAVARASKLDWRSVACSVTGTLDRPGKRTRFVRLMITARLNVGAETSPQRAERVLEKAKDNCLVSNSLSCEVDITTDIVTEGS